MFVVSSVTFYIRFKRAALFLSSDYRLVFLVLPRKSFSLIGAIVTRRTLIERENKRECRVSRDRSFAVREFFHIFLPSRPFRGISRTKGCQTKDKRLWRFSLELRRHNIGRVSPHGRWSISRCSRNNVGERVSTIMLYRKSGLLYSSWRLCFVPVFFFFFFLQKLVICRLYIRTLFDRNFAQ